MKVDPTNSKVAALLAEKRMQNISAAELRAIAEKWQAIVERAPAGSVIRATAKERAELYAIAADYVEQQEGGNDA
jgi:hypothetical protein